MDYLKFMILFLIDTPPVNTVTDAQVFLQYVPDCVMVIDAENNNKMKLRKLNH